MGVLQICAYTVVHGPAFMLCQSLIVLIAYWYIWEFSTDSVQILIQLLSWKVDIIRTNGLPDHVLPSVFHIPRVLRLMLHTHVCRLYEDV